MAGPVLNAAVTATDEPCPGCGFVCDLAHADLAGAAVTVGVAEFAALLNGNTDAVRVRADPAVWSVLEYGCHLRDVLLVQRERVLAARRQDLPVCEPMGREERVEHDGYAQQDPGEVAAQLSMAAVMFTGVLARLGPGDWDRRLVYNWPRRAERSLRWLAAHTAHECRHHLLDVRNQAAGC